MDRQNRHFRIGVGKFFDRPEFGRQSRQFLSAKSAKIGESAKSGNRPNRPNFFAEIATLKNNKILFCQVRKK